MKHALFVLAAFVVASPALAQENVRVHIETNNPNVTLEARTDEGWAEVCSGTCDRTLSKLTRYRVHGEGVTPSRSLVLIPTSDDGFMRLYVNTGANGLHQFGLVSLFTGIAGIGGGLALLAIGALENSCSNCVSGFADTTMLNIGWTLAGVSALAVIVGGFATSGSKTQVATSLVSDDWGGVARVPLREKRAIDALPPIVGIPIFGTSF